MLIQLAEYKQALMKRIRDLRREIHGDQLSYDFIEPDDIRYREIQQIRAIAKILKFDLKERE